MHPDARCVSRLLLAGTGLELGPGISGALVNFAAVADIVEVEPASLSIELVKHAVITDAQSALGTSGPAMVRIGAESHAHFVHLPLDGFPDCGGKLVKGFAAGV